MTSLLLFSAVANAASVPITLGISAIIGLFLFVMGRKLMKVAVGLCGLCIGAFAAFIGANQLGVTSQLMIVWVIGGAIAGVLLASLLFRFWMAVSLAALFALAVPAFSVIFQGTPAVSENGEKTDTKTQALPLVTDEAEKKDDDEPKKKSDIPVNNFSTEDAKKVADELKKVVPIDVTEEQIEKATRTIMDVLQHAYEFQKEHLTRWWEELKPEGQRSLGITAGIAGLVGALMGFVLPSFSASIQTSLTGGAVLLSTVHGVVTAYAPQHLSWIPSEPRALLITLSLITLVGICIQWTLWRGTADK